MSSPIAQPGLHDTFVLLNGSKRIVLPGIARVTVGLAANLDTQATPGGGNTQTQLNEATGEVTVQLTMTEHTEWLKYRDVLAILRRGTQPGGLAVFTCAHPEVASRRIKRLYFNSEQSQPYSPKSGYVVSMTFKEQLKASATATTLGSGETLIIPGAGSDTPPAGITAAPTSAEGQRLITTAIAQAGGKPIPVPGTGGKTTASAGLCSAFTREAWMATHNGDRSLFGGSANETEARFKAAKMTIPWSAAAQSSLQAGDLVFYGRDPSGYGHVGVYDGKGGVVGNNYVTYGARGGLLDAAGRATGYDAAGRPVDARGTVPLAKLGTPTSIAKPTAAQVPVKLIQGPPAPISAPQGKPALPAAAPSAKPPGPPGAFKLARPVNATASQFPGVKP